MDSFEEANQELEELEEELFSLVITPLLIAQLVGAVIAGKITGKILVSLHEKVRVLFYNSRIKIAEERGSLPQGTHKLFVLALEIISRPDDFVDPEDLKIGYISSDQEQKQAKYFLLRLVAYMKKDLSFLGKCTTVNTNKVHDEKTNSELTITNVQCKPFLAKWAPPRRFKPILSR